MAADRETRKESERKKAYLQKYIAAGLEQKSMQREIEELQREQANFERMEGIIHQMRTQLGLPFERGKASSGQEAAMAEFEQRLRRKSRQKPPRFSRK